MKYVFKRSSSEHWATNLRIEKLTNNLIWDNAPGQNVFIVQTPFGETALDRMEEICNALCEKAPGDQEFREIYPQIWVNRMTVSSKARKGQGCPIHDLACTYSVVAYSEQEDEIELYINDDQGMSTPFCNIPMEMTVYVQREMEEQRRGLFGLKKVIVESDWWSIRFTKGDIMNYMDGSLRYTIGQYTIPITKQMISQGTVYVCSGNQRPVVETRNKGIKLVI